MRKKQSKNKKTRGSWPLLIGVFVAIFATFYFGRTAYAANPTTMPFQGKVTNANGTNVADGNYSITFKLYTVSSGGSSVWGETQASVAVAAGVFQVNLGSTCSLFTTQTCSGFSNTAIDFNANPTLYLGMTFNGDAAGEMSPRIQLGSVPYAFNADKVGGVSASQIVQLGASQAGNINITSGTLSAATVKANTIDTSSGSTLNLGGASTTSISFTGNLNLGAGYTFAMQGATPLSLGSASTVGSMLFRDGTSNTYYTILSATAQANTYTLNLPTTGATGTQCMQSTSGSTNVLSSLQWGSCGVTGIGTYSTANTAADGATISGSTITFQDASASAPGMVSNGTQTFGGAKTFSGNVTISGTNSLTVGTIFKADGTGAQVVVGSTTTDTTETDFVLDKLSTFADANSCVAADYGSMYYNTATNAVRTCINGAWEDLISTAGLGIITFGVIPDSGANPGDLMATSTAGVTGPCKVSWASATTVTIQACSVYTGGRKITQAQVTVTLPAMAVNTFTHLCFWSGGAATGPITNATSWFSTTSLTETANLPTFSANNPVVCLATIKNNATTANTIGQIFDTRVFTTSQKQFVNTSVAMAPAWLAIATTTDTTKVTAPAALATKGIMGVTVAGSSAAWASGGPNAIIATSGPVEIKAIAGATNAYNYIQTSGTTGYATTVTTASATLTVPALYIGLAQTAFGSCATPSASACQGSILTNIQYMD